MEYEESFVEFLMDLTLAFLRFYFMVYNDGRDRGRTSTIL